jgi:hypothetical protein
VGYFGRTPTGLTPARPWQAVALPGYWHSSCYLGAREEEH